MAKKSQRKFETPKVLHDAPLRADDEHYFNFDEFAITLSRLIASKDTRTPLTIGVSGAWGSGKTTLLRRVKKMLDDAGNLAEATKIAYRSDEDKPEKDFRV
jgi:predicted AAA+ superfamily ATPase